MYPRCLAGARACPPEDCGGPHGYERLLATTAKPRTAEAKSLLKWLGGPFDPEAFDARWVGFDNPKQRWKVAFGQRLGLGGKGARASSENPLDQRQTRHSPRAPPI